MLHLSKIFEVLKSAFHSNNYLSTQCLNYLVTYFGTQCGVLSENENVGVFPTAKIFKTFKTHKMLWQFARTVSRRMYWLEECPGMNPSKKNSGIVKLPRALVDVLKVLVMSTKFHTRAWGPSGTLSECTRVCFRCTQMKTKGQGETGIVSRGTRQPSPVLMNRKVMNTLT